MEAATWDLFGFLGEPEREGLLEVLAGDGPELGSLLIDLAQVARSKGKTKLANMLYNSALFQEDARGRNASPVAIESLGALADTDLRLGNAPQALRWASRMQRVALDDKTKKRADRLQGRIRKSRGDADEDVNPFASGGRSSGVATPTEFEAVAPSLTFEDVGGLIRAKDALRRLAILPHRDPESAKRFGIAMGGGVLLYGPPGCGKTMLAEAAAGEMGVPIIKVKASDILHPLYGMSERNLAEAFKTTRDKAPCVLFIDEIDGLARQRGADFLHLSLVGPLLMEAEALNATPGVLLIGATNVLDQVDRALTRPGRFDKVVAVDMPDSGAREMIWSTVLRNYPCGDGIECAELSRLSSGLSGAEIAEVARTAAESVWMQYLQDGVERTIEMLDLLISLRARFTDGATKHTIDEMLADGWREALD
jgi:AAA+ superfamily predicted ATPase